MKRRLAPFVVVADDQLLGGDPILKSQDGSKSCVKGTFKCTLNLSYVVSHKVLLLIFLSRSAVVNGKISSSKACSLTELDSLVVTPPICWTAVSEVSAVSAALAPLLTRRAKWRECRLPPATLPSLLSRICLQSERDGERDAIKDWS